MARTAMDPEPFPIAAPVDVDPWVALDALPAAVVLLSEGGVVQWVNERATRVLGLDRAAALGRPVGEIVERCAERGLTAERADGTPGVLLLQRDPADADRASYLADVSDQLAGSLHLERTMQRIVALAVPPLADACLLSVVDGLDLQRVGAVVRHGVTEQWQEEGLSGASSVEAVARVRRTGAAELHAAVDPELLSTLVPPGPLWSPLREPAPHTAMVVPVRARGVTGAALVLLGKEGRSTYGPGDLELAHAFASRAAVALDNASLYRERSVVAQVLQQSLLPPRLPPVPGLEIGAAYRPLVQTSDIGGDFYDVFPTGAETWVVTVGDIGGKGIAAAATTGLARHTIRAAAVQAGEPSAVLRALNDVVLEDDTDRLCTVVLARVVPTPGGADLVLASAGHPCPLLLRADGTVSEVPVAGTLLGAFTDVDLVDVPLHLGPGDALLLYTDGVTEARVGGEQFGDDRLCDLLRSSVGLHADTVAKRVMQEVVDFLRGGQTDDIAVVVVRVPDAVEP